jgi:UDP-N-acetylglucosamine 2-epimerase (non-hydrolysing)
LDIGGGTFGEQMGNLFRHIQPIMESQAPDRVLILGDTNSGLSAIAAARLGIPVFHMEAGNRCYDDRVPEEVNRRIIDHSSAVLLPYTHRSKENLIAEGISADRVHVTGNPIKEVMDAHRAEIATSDVLDVLGVRPGEFFLVTMHRAENVDVEWRLRAFIDTFELLAAKYGMPVVCSLHPRTRSRAESFGVDLGRSGVRFVEPFGFFDFVALERSAFCILTDSGTVQEEACILGKANITIRDVTERPETLDVGSNVLAPADPETIAGLVDAVVAREGRWTPPGEYLATNVAETVANLLLSHR